MSEKLSEKMIRLHRPAYVDEVMPLESRLAKAQARLEVAEKIMEHFFAETDEADIFGEYCKLCNEDEDCEWGDNFPYCFTEKPVKCAKLSSDKKKELEDFRDKLSRAMDEKPTKEEIEKREKLVREMGTLRPEDYFKRTTI